MWALALLLVFAVEIVLTLWDFVVEDRTRLLPATERVTHTVLAMNGGAFITLLALTTPQWLAMPTALIRFAGGREVTLQGLQDLGMRSGASGLVLGDYLTTQGRKDQEDFTMLDRLGFEVLA